MMRRSRLANAGRSPAGRVALDRTVPALLMKVGRYPLHQGSVGAVRTLGRLGVRVFAVTEDRFTPTARSRYLFKRFLWPTSGAEDPQELVAGMLAIGARIGARAVLLPTDDEAALLAAEHADVLSEHFLLPNVAGDLPRRLASKRGLAELCADVGVPAPASARPKSVAELFEIVGTMGFPVVLKNDAAWERLSNPAVWCTTIVRDAPELERLASSWPSMPGVLVLFPASEQASAARLQSFLDAAESERVAAEDAATLRDAPAVVEETAR